MRNDNSSITNYTATLANIPIQFNGNEINEMLIQNTDKAKTILNALIKQKQGLIMIRNDNSITNYTATLANIPIQFNVCVGQHIESELELKGYYPKCNFLALDPVAEVNADLVEKQLNGTFIERVITAEDSYTANKKANIWNSQGQNFCHIINLTQPREGLDCEKILSSFTLPGKRKFNGNFDELSIGFFDFFQFYSDKSVIDLLLLDVFVYIQNHGELNTTHM
uniref:Uncharacterized protein n=1 Tax=Meloidogyne floridensis TaxID=298350 RepID=A0A915NJZ9_9BILA